MNYLEKKIVFHEDEILTFQDQETGKIYVAVTMICNSLGMSENQRDTQVKKIKNDGTLKLGAKELTVKIDGQVREQMFIELEFLTGWLFKINPARFSEELKEKLIDYQLHCQEILTDEFFGKRELLLPGHNDEKLNPHLNDIDDRSSIIRGIEAELTKLYDELVYHYNWIKNRSEVKRDEYIGNIRKAKQKRFIDNGKELTTEDIDKLNGR
ncbi:P22_AR N-terminal domain [Sebaldella termitidis]|uniref:Antirepressor protein ant N-terminal domain-containing protein n=1 Tax=Sebaldella termitidis (strain ATCC 33386 / NCTC 11300) TaxID=526218 RepID=D1AR31_SEBTE|nr:phage antirepressor N-terminal domain-containing protein [Sebaldella termitidis]ACZ07719.1 hypothetical protein Sterm_0847 [Sebaldella termitidis ATCC 33386]SUI23016.1 P22_AR N-terminal domain [Sebaldella termitidis]